MGESGRKWEKVGKSWEKLGKVANSVEKWPKVEKVVKSGEKWGKAATGHFGFSDLLQNR